MFFGPTPNPKDWRTVVLIFVCLLILDLFGLVGSFPARSPCKTQAIPPPARYQHKGGDELFRGRKKKSDVTIVIEKTSQIVTFHQMLKYETCDEMWRFVTNCDITFFFLSFVTIHHNLAKFVITSPDDLWRIRTSWVTFFFRLLNNSSKFVT